MSRKDNLTDIQKHHLTAFTVNQAMLMELPSEEEIDATPIPQSLQVRIDQLLNDFEKKQKTSQVKKHLTKIAACILLFTVLPLSVALSVEASREMIFQFLEGYFSISDKQEFNPDVDANFPIINYTNLYIPVWMPKDYLATTWSNITDPMTIVYSKGTQKIRFIQKSSDAIQLEDNEIKNLTMYEVSGQTYFYGDKEHSNEFPHKLIWQNNGYYFSLESVEDQDTLFEIAKNIKWKGN